MAVQQPGAVRTLLRATCLVLLTSSAVQASIQSAACLGQVFAEMGFRMEDVPQNDTECLRIARGQPHEADFVAALRPQSKSIPAAEPALAAYDWDRRVRAERPPGWPNLPEGMCQPNKNWELTRVKIYKGVLYAHYPHNDTSSTARSAWRASRAAVYEQLLLVMWLYKDVPDMDLIINVHSHAMACNTTLPVLQFTVFNSTSPTTGDMLDVDPNNWPCKGPTGIANPCAGYTKGFTMPTADAMKLLGISPQQLWWYSFCVHARYIRALAAAHPPFQCNVPRNAVAFWRGTATGNTHGWPRAQAEQWQYTFNQSRAVAYFFGSLLTKRISAALMANYWPWMDVGLTGVYDRRYKGFNDRKENQFVSTLMRKITFKDQLGIEQWNRNHLVLNLDGAGVSSRLRRLLLGNVPVVKVESILREWFIEHAVPGVHYVPARYDLSDIGHVTRQLLEEAQYNSSRLERMAVAAAALMVERANLLAQLDAMAWSLARIKEVCPWEVLPPDNAVTAAHNLQADEKVESGWHVVKLPQPSLYAVVPQTVRDSLLQRLGSNFL